MSFPSMPVDYALGYLYSLLKSGNDYGNNSVIFYSQLSEIAEREFSLGKEYKLSDIAKKDFSFGKDYNEDDVKSFIEEVAEDLEDLEDVDLSSELIRGMAETSLCIHDNYDSNKFSCCFRDMPSEIMEYIQKFTNVKISDDNSYHGNNALDFMGKLYEGNPYTKDVTYIDTYNYMCNLQLGEYNPIFKFKRTDEKAVPPKKERSSDSGFDITIIKKIKTKGKVVYYDTCVQIFPEFGWYCDIVPRSSLSKTGYILANSVGIIDRTYTGNIIVALMKVDDDAPEISLPFRAVQLIPRTITHPSMIEITDDIAETARGDGGFGSTDK